MDTKVAWSLEAELCALTGTASVREAVEAISGRAFGEEGHRLGEIRPWQRGGAETYNYVFSLNIAAERWVLLIKAFVAPTFGVDPDAQLVNWRRRRLALQNSNVRVPKLYAANKGAWVEEFILVDGSEALRASAADEATSSALREKLAVLVDKVQLAGFSPVSIIANLRWDGNEFVWVDFGSDLGAPAAHQNSARRGFALLEEELAEFSPNYPDGARHDG